MNSERIPILMDILNGLNFNCGLITDHDEIDVPGFYIFRDSPSTLTYWCEHTPMIDQLPNKLGMMLNGFVDYEKNLSIDVDAITIHAEIWKEEIVKTNKRFAKWH